MLQVIVIILVGLIMEAAGVVLLAKAVKAIPNPALYPLQTLASTVLFIVRNPLFWLGLALELGFFLCLLTLLAMAPVSVTWPLTSLGFVITTLAARLLLNETVTLTRWIGVILIMLGAALVMWSEHRFRTGVPAPQEETVYLQ